ncbi:MAG: 1-acyl-sn-glycerol-3-phosphate acyltransferase [Acidimicrobiales bacterium]|nr:1-acyl-sn-glycerol-3-phosphate acyltransferase [Acidimicrobiales bacterium]
MHETSSRRRRLGPDRTLAVLARVARLLTAPFIRYEIRGGACAKDLKVGVIACNHRSLFDVVAGLITLHHFRKYPRLLIARKYVDGRWTAPFARAIGSIPVDRGQGRGGALEPALATLAAGAPVLIMPEGRLHWDPEQPLSTGRAYTGVARLAVAAGTVVVPAALVGTEKVWPSNRWLPRLNPFRRKIVVVNVADEVLVLAGDDHEANTEQVMAEIRRLMAEASTGR